MPWIFFNDEEAALFKTALTFHIDCSDVGERKPMQELLERVEQAGTPGEDDAYYAEDAAYRLSDPDEIEGFPDHPYVSESDEGAYVMAWIWVEKPDDAVEEDEDKDATNE